MKEMTNEERKALWLKYLCYQWDFTRRNKEYRATYEDYRETPEGGEKIAKQIAMAEKWGFAVNPDNSKPYFLGLGHALPGNLKIIKSPHIEYMTDGGAIIMGGIVDLKTGKMDKELVVSINLEGPDWVTLASLENLLRIYRFNWKIKEKRISWKTLDDYLQVNDLSEGGFDDEYIAKKVF